MNDVWSIKYKYSYSQEAYSYEAESMMEAYRKFDEICKFIHTEYATLWYGKTLKAEYDKKV